MINVMIEFAHNRIIIFLIGEAVPYYYFLQCLFHHSYFEMIDELQMVFILQKFVIRMV